MHKQLPLRSQVLRAAHVRLVQLSETYSTHAHAQVQEVTMVPFHCRHKQNLEMILSACHGFHRSRPQQDKCVLDSGLPHCSSSRLQVLPMAEKGAPATAISVSDVGMSSAVAGLH
jgi:hypothetical protein